MFTASQSALVFVDVQGRLAEGMVGREGLFRNLERLVRGVRALGLPILWTEQNPARMGGTAAPFPELLAGVVPIPKMSFGCCGEPTFMSALEALGRRACIVAGIECHVCIHQTVVQLLARGYAVQVPADAVSSRAELNLNLGLSRLRTAGADVTCVESVLFELMQTADHPAFRTVLGIVK